MPVIAVNVPIAVFEEVRALVERGQYASPEQFLEVAAFNQIALERGVRPDDLSASRPPVRPTPPPVSGPTNGGTADGTRPSTRRQRMAEEERPAAIPTRAARSVPKGELSATLGRLSLKKCEEADATGTTAQARPESERLWGQVNRLFPMKLACRWIAVASVGSKRWPKYDTIMETLASDAAVIGSALEALDASAGRKRDDVLSTGLPRRGNPAARDRFLSQFIARTTRSLELYPGAICHYALAEFTGEAASPRLALTDRGIALARLPNPVLDEDPEAATTTLSEEERSFFVEQVLQYVPGELKDLRGVLGAINDGCTRPEELFASVRPGLPANWTDAMARTHLSGLVARLTEMAVLRRRWEGRTVTYEPTTGTSALVTQ